MANLVGSKLIAERESNSSRIARTVPTMESSRYHGRMTRQMLVADVNSVCVGWTEQWVADETFLRR